jgi:phosphatidylglycerophosphate synthase
MYDAIRGGGGWWSLQVSSRLGSHVAVQAHRARLTPNQVTALGGGLGLLTSAAVVLSADDRRRAAVVAFAGWQLSYAFDCADGQLARATGQTGPTGALLDLLWDFAVQVGVVASTVRVAWRDLSGPSAVLLGGGLTIGLFDAAVANLLVPRSRAATFEVGRARLLARTARDYGVFVALVPALIATENPRLLRSVLVARALLDTAFVARRALGLMQVKGGHQTV